ncbi:unnamed protein product [Timema podura]|uniref:Uncharacterized protein n=1 Tax=Timema podura TaxID=61482 RepID=A0ABN7P6Q8_TIMPD|nr:unnamed protein product [Timema podura]
MIVPSSPPIISPAIRGEIKKPTTTTHVQTNVISPPVKKTNGLCRGRSGPVPSRVKTAPVVVPSTGRRRN